jgi:hypothetical protein
MKVVTADSAVFAAEFWQNHEWLAATVLMLPPKERYAVMGVIDMVLMYALKYVKERQ